MSNAQGRTILVLRTHLLRTHLHAARQATDPAPTRAQKEAGNYKKGRVKVAPGLVVAIENPKGSVRRGVDGSGKAWAVRMKHDYGYFVRPHGSATTPMGVDGDPVDVFLGPHPHAELAFVVDQVDPNTGRFDEHKVVLGALTEDEARQVYLANYSPGWKGLGAITPMTLPALRRWLRRQEKGQTSQRHDAPRLEKGGPHAKRPMIPFHEALPLSFVPRSSPAELLVAILCTKFGLRKSLTDDGGKRDKSNDEQFLCSGLWREQSPVLKAVDRRGGKGNLAFDFGSAPKQPPPAPLIRLDRRPKEPRLSDYHVVLVNSSGGKDSQAMLDYVAAKAKREGVSDRVHVVHADLGRVEWKGTKDIARKQAAHYGFPFHVVSRPQGDLLSHVEQRGMWPSSQQRYCTSDHKRGQIRKVMTGLTTERWQKGRPPVRILNCMGLRAAESPARSKKTPFEHDDSASNGKRHVDNWLPIHHFSHEQVWDRVKQAGTPVHPAYKLGMPRLSCVFCIFAPKPALMLAGKHNPELLQQHVDVEKKIGHRFRQDVSLAEVQRAIHAGEKPGAIKTWEM